NVALLTGGNNFIGKQSFQAEPLIVRSFEDIFVAEAEWQVLFQVTNTEGHPMLALVGAAIDFDTFPEPLPGFPEGILRQYMTAEWGQVTGGEPGELAVQLTQTQFVVAGDDEQVPEGSPLAVNRRLVGKSLRLVDLFTGEMTPDASLQAVRNP